MPSRARGAMFGALILASFMMGMAAQLGPPRLESLAGFLDKRPGSPMQAAFMPSPRLPWTHHTAQLLKSQGKLCASRLSELSIAQGPSFLSMASEAKKTTTPRIRLPMPDPVERVRRQFKQVADNDRYYNLSSKENFHPVLACFLFFSEYEEKACMSLELTRFLHTSSQEGCRLRVVSYNVLGPIQAMSAKHAYAHIEHRSDFSMNACMYVCACVHMHTSDRGQ
jgi:hypothetical protein